MKRNEARFEPLNVGRTLVVLTFWFRNILYTVTTCTFSTSRPLKVVRACGILFMLISKCTSYYNGVYFFDILISKNPPILRHFVYFELEMYFALQRRVHVRYLMFDILISKSGPNFQKWSENGVFCIFWLGNVLRTTTAYIFSTF
jgi:hypothetical protein